LGSDRIRNLSNQPIAKEKHMKIIAIWTVALGFSGAIDHATRAEPVPALSAFSAKLIEQIRRSVLSDAVIPMDEKLYDAQFTYGHWAGDLMVVPVGQFLKEFAAEGAAGLKVIAGHRVAVTRFVANGDDIAVTRELTGTLPDKTDLRLENAIFFTIKDGRIACIEIMSSEPSAGQLMRYVMRDPDVIAVEGKQ
jgi:hypothetical protein